MLSNLPCVRSFSGMERIIFASASLKTSLTTTLSHDPCYCMDEFTDPLFEQESGLVQNDSPSPLLQIIPFFRSAMPLSTMRHVCDMPSLS